MFKNEDGCPKVAPCAPQCVSKGDFEQPEGNSFLASSKKLCSSNESSTPHSKVISGDDSVTVEATTDADGTMVYTVSVEHPDGTGEGVHTVPSKVISGDDSVTVEATTDDDGAVVYTVSVEHPGGTGGEFDKQYLPVPATLPANPNPQEKLFETNVDYGTANLQNIVDSVVLSRDHFRTLGMRDTDNAMRIVIRVSYKMKGNAFQPPYTTDVATGMIVQGENRIVRTGWSGAVSDNVSFGSYLVKMDANDQITVDYTGYVEDLPANSSVLQVWGLDVSEFCQVP